jgi:uncharacterized protein (TIGR02996 family)
MREARAACFGGLGKLSAMDDAFLGAILAEPDDDTPRLVYADWLEERGDPRGEFIRLQVGLFEANGSAQMVQIVRAQELLIANEETWAATVRPLVAECQFERGFVTGITLPLDAFLEHADTLFARAPIQRVKISDVGTRIAQIAANPYLERLSGLDLSGNGLGDTGARILAADAHLPRLDSLNLGMNFMDIEGVRALAKAGRLSRLRRLALEHNHVHDMGAYALASAANLSGLRELNLKHAEITTTGARYLAETTCLVELRSLDLSHNGLGDSGARALAKPKKLAHLRELRLRDCSIGATAARALADSPLAGRLKCLDLRGNPIARTQQEILHKAYGAGVCLF